MNWLRYFPLPPMRNAQNERYPPGVRFILIRPSLMKLFSPANVMLLLRLSQANNCQYHVKSLHQPGLLLQGKKYEFLIFTEEAFAWHKKKSQTVTFLLGKERLNSTTLVFCSTELEGGSEITTPAPNTFNPRLIQLEISHCAESSSKKI